MSVESFQELPIEQLGGICTCVDPADVPIGMSTYCQDVEFYPGGVRTRPGALAAYDAIGAAGTARVLGLKSHVTLALTQKLLVYDSEGNLRAATPGNPLVLLRSGLKAGARMDSLTLFGAEWIGLSDGITGLERPLSWDPATNNLDRVSMYGPGDAPTVVEPAGAAINVESIANSGAMRTANLATLKYTGLAITAAAGAGTGAVRTANVATINVVAHGRAVNDKINVTGVSDATFNLNGLTVTAVPDADHLSYVSNGADVVSGVAGGGNIYTYLAVGASILVAGISDATFSGRQTVTAIASASSISYVNAGADVPAATAGTGTITANAFGSIEIGVRNVVYWWITRTGYWTKYSPKAQYTATGGSKAQVTLPVGPANVIARGIAFTTSGGANLWHLEDRMLIADNVTTTVTIDFDDTTLASGLSVDYLRRLEVLNYATKPIRYASRLFWIGEENGLSLFNNLGFDGGARVATGGPMGWTEGATFAGGSVADLSPAEFGCAYRITGDGATVTRGLISQSVMDDAWTGVQILQGNKAYRVRARVRRSVGLVAGRLNIDLFGTAVDTAGIQVNAADLADTAWHEFDAELTAALASLPADLVLRVFADNTPTNGQYFDVDELRIIPSAELELASRARGSIAEDPESYDGTKGFLLVEENNGQALRSGFVLRNYLYLVKERSMHATADDGSSEPSDWSLEEVSGTVGTPSTLGCDVGEGWAIIANKAGAFFYEGGTPQNISREIQNADPSKGLWDRVNWEGAGTKVWVKVDTKIRRVLFGVPLDAATDVSHILQLDYSDLPGPVGALLTDPVENEGRGRKWTIWNIAAGAAAILETAGTSRLFLGNNAGNGKIYELASTQRSDNGVAINSIYDTAYIGGSGFGERLFGFMVAAIEGAGTLLRRAWRPGGIRFKALQDRTLSSPNQHDKEMMMNVSDNRLAFRFQTNAVGSWFSLAKLRIYTKQGPWSGK